MYLNSFLVGHSPVAISVYLSVYMQFIFIELGNLVLQSISHRINVEHIYVYIYIYIYIFMLYIYTYVHMYLPTFTIKIN